MADDTIVYEYRSVAGLRLPGNVPAQDLTAHRLAKMTPAERREVEAFAAAGQFFHPVNKSTATRTLNKLQREDAREAEAAADAAKEGDR